MGYESSTCVWHHPQGRVALFLGDLTDRGPESLAALELVDAMIQAGSGRLAALGNHDWKLYRYGVLRRNVILSYGLDRTVRELAAAVEERRYRPDDVEALLRRLFEQAPACSVVDVERLVITHGGVEHGHQNERPTYNRRDPHSALCLNGQTTGKKSADGRVQRIYDWVAGWGGGAATVIFGHDVVGREVVKLGDSQNVWAIDTGCAFGGRLTCVRWPEREIVQVDAHRRYADHPNIP